MASSNSTKIVSHYDVLSRDLSDTKAILKKALTALDHLKANPRARDIAYWRNRLNHAVGLVELADNEADCLREVAVDALAVTENVIPFPLKPERIKALHRREEIAALLSTAVDIDTGLPTTSMEEARELTSEILDGMRQWMEERNPRALSASNVVRLPLPQSDIESDSQDK